MGILFSSMVLLYNMVMLFKLGLMDFGEIITNITVPIVYNVLHRLLDQYGVKKWLLILDSSEHSSNLRELWDSKLAREPDTIRVEYQTGTAACGGHYKQLER